MKAYLIVTGGVFALLVAAHVLRMVIEGPGVASDPWFVAATVVSLGMLAWAIRLLRGPRVRPEPNSTNGASGQSG